ncbi:MAG: LysM peptidoglycan-binding domain-containing protein [Myxococcota bacterium]
MSLFSDLLKGAVGGSAGDSDQQSAGLVEGLLELVQQSGGVEGLSKTLEARGLGAETASWIGTGANRPVSADQLLGALGRDRVGALARRAGLGESLGAGAIAAILPALIDKLTPDGRPPGANELRERSGSILGDLVGGRAAAPARPKADFSNVQAGSSQAQVPQEEVYTVVAGDSLSKIAKRSYGDANQWRRIFEANRDQIKNPDLIQPGWKLRIPKP